MTFNGEEQIGIGGGKLPSSSPSKKFGGMLHPPPPKFKELREFMLLEGRGTKPWWMPKKTPDTPLQKRTQV